jgi:beta-glucuronidase
VRGSLRNANATVLRPDRTTRRSPSRGGGQGRATWATNLRSYDERTRVNSWQAVRVFGAVASVAAAAGTTATPRPNRPSRGQPQPALFPMRARPAPAGPLGPLAVSARSHRPRPRPTAGSRAARPHRGSPVPCSWNDLFDDARDYFGTTAWYETEFQARPGWSGRRITCASARPSITPGSG